jgi:hypothetical protein
MSEAPTPESAPLTVDQAVASLLTPPVEQEQPASEAPQEAAETPDEPQGEPEAPTDAEDGAETPAEGEEAEAASEEPVEALEPPKYWSTDAKAKFAELPPELQAVVLEQEGPREEASAKAKAEAAKQVDAANAELSKVNELAAALTERLPKWVETFASKWGTQTPDWVSIAQEHGVEAMTLAKTQYEAERQQLEEAAAATTKAQQIAHQTFLQTEWKALAELSPDLAPDVADPQKGADKRKAVVQYLSDYNFPQSAIAEISAAELTIAHKAMLYDRGQAALKAAPKPKPAAAAPRTPVRPGAGQSQSSSSSTAKSAMGRFHQKPSVDNAVALLLASKG